MPLPALFSKHERDGMTPIDQRARVRAILAIMAAVYAFAGALALTVLALTVAEAARVETALPIFLASLTPAGTLLGYFKGRDS